MMYQKERFGPKLNRGSPHKLERKAEEYRSQGRNHMPF